MERSFAFVPRSVSRKPSQERKSIAEAAKLKQKALETSDNKDVERSTTEVSEVIHDKSSDAGTLVSEASSKDSQGKTADLAQGVVISVSKNSDAVIKQKSTVSEKEVETLEHGEPKLKLGEDITTVKDTDKTKQSDFRCKENIPCSVTDPVSSSKLGTSDSAEQSVFSFSSFVDSVITHNNLQMLQKENHPLQQIASSENVSVTKTDTVQSTEQSEFSFSSFAEAVYKQSNLPLIDVGALSPRRKIPCFVRQKAPICVPKQPIFDPTGIGTPLDRGYSMYTGRPGTSYAQDMEPAPKRFRNFVAPKRKPELCFGHPRDWELTQCGRQYFRKPKSQQQGLEFTVMSYNVLAQNLLRDNMYLYTDCDYDVLEWKYRKEQLLAELKHHKPDVICLQEVQKAHYEDFFRPKLHKLGYTSAYVKRSGNKHDGCATFVNSSKFHLETSTPIEYYHPQGGKVLDRDNVALIVKLKPISEHVPSERRVCVANTHLLFNPRRGDVKLAQIMVLLAELDKCGYKTGSGSDRYHPMVLCGDFNSEPHSELYKLLTMGRLHYDGLLCRVLSGQSEGLHKGNDIALEKRFMPMEVGISDNCQYLDVLKSRDQGHTIDLTASENLDLEEGEIEMTGSQGTGMLNHDFNLVSAYKHTVSRLRHRHKEITTYHNKAACTVDYIFYGVRFKESRFWDGEVEMRNIEEGPLHLLGRYGLLAEHELQKMGGLPNESLASDHLSILASFLLK